MSLTESRHLQDAPLTYLEVGATAMSVLPPGYHHLRMREQVGTGEDDFACAVEALAAWRVQRGAGFAVHASAPEVGENTVAILAAGRRPLRVHAPVRVVYKVAEPCRRGFGYGTLPGHPVAGEEAFVVDRTADGRVMFTVTAFSRPVWWPLRFVGPLGRLGQRLMARRYARALRAETTRRHRDQDRR